MNTFTKNDFLLPRSQGDDEVTRIERIEGSDIGDVKIFMDASNSRECLLTVVKEFLKRKSVNRWPTSLQKTYCGSSHANRGFILGLGGHRLFQEGSCMPNLTVYTCCQS